jgi:hypothetical protein
VTTGAGPAGAIRGAGAVRRRGGCPDERASVAVVDAGDGAAKADGCLVNEFGREAEHSQLSARARPETVKRMAAAVGYRALGRILARPYSPVQAPGPADSHGLLDPSCACLRQTGKQETETVLDRLNFALALTAAIRLICRDTPATSGISGFIQESGVSEGAASHS